MSAQPTTTTNSQCPKDGGGLNMTTTTPTGTAVGHVLIFSGQPRFTIPLLTIPALTGSGLDGFSLGLNYLTGFDGFTSSDGTVGLHFNYSQNATLTASGLDVILENGDNTQVVFTSTDGINYSSAGNNSSAILRRYNAGTYSETFTLTGAGGVVTVFSGIGSAVDVPGRPLSLSDRFGNTQTFNWAAASPARLQSVTDSYGRTTNFSYGSGPAYQMKEVTDFQGRKVNLQYDSSGRLIAIVLPSINSGANGNTFPNGTGYVFEYDTGNPRSDRQNDLIAVYYPNQVNGYIDSTRTVNVSGVYSTATPRRQFAYFQDPTDPFTYGKVQQVTESATGTGSIGAGAWGFLYSDTGLPANLLNPYDPIVSTAVVTDRNNNSTSFDFNAAGMTVCMIASSRGKSSLEPGPWTTWMAYNAHNQLTLQVNPAGDSVAYAYEDESNTVTIDGQPYPLRVGLLQSVTRYAGNSFGIPSRPGSNGQTQLATLYFHDLYSQTAATIEPRGNPVDSSNDFFSPQNLGATPTLTGRSRYATVNYFDYQKDALTTLQADSNLIAALGLTSAGDLATLVTFTQGQMSAVGLSFPLAIGDVNGQGTGAGSSGGPARHDGAAVMTTRPSVSQLIPNGQGAYPQTVLFDSPSAYWRLGETSGTTAADSSGDGYSGTYTGGYTLGEPGALADDNNASVLVNGSTGCADFGAASPISGAGDFTVEAWINISSFVEAVPGNYVSYAVAKGADYLGDVGGNTTNAFGLAVGGGTDGSGHASAGAAVYFMCGMPNPTYNSYLTWVTDLSLGQWYHLVGVKQGSTMSLYVNGQLQASQAYTGSINADATLEMLIGKTQRGSPYTYAFDGKVDEAALYNSALSADRILAHYNAGTGADAWVWQTQSVHELYTHNKKGQRTTVTNAEGNLTLYVRYPENNPDGTGTCLAHRNLWRKAA